MFLRCITVHITGRIIVTVENLKLICFILLLKEYLFRLDKVIYVGDDPRDMLASANAFCSGIFLGEKKN